MEKFCARNLWAAQAQQQRRLCQHGRFSKRLRKKRAGQGNWIPAVQTTICLNCNRRRVRCPRRNIAAEQFELPAVAWQIGQINMRNFLIAFLRDEEGLTMVEYAVAGTLITLAAVTAFTNLGTAVSTKIGDIVTALGGAAAK
jgi:pilus assembly protein Flp/PilA